jgi:2,5-diketo-D-gluconate reductase A
VCTIIGQGANELLTHPLLAPIATAHGWTIAQLLLAWGLQRGVCAVLPRSSNHDRIAANISWSTATNRTPLTETEMATVATLNNDHHFCWNSQHVK